MLLGVQANDRIGVDPVQASYKVGGERGDFSLISDRVGGERGNYSLKYFFKTLFVWSSGE